MIILKHRGWITAEELAIAAEMYAKQAEGGVIVLDDNTDLVHVSEPENVIKLITGLDPENEEEQEQSEEEE